MALDYSAQAGDDGGTPGTTHWSLLRRYGPARETWLWVSCPGRRRPGPALRHCERSPQEQPTSVSTGTQTQHNVSTNRHVSALDKALGGHYPARQVSSKAISSGVPCRGVFDLTPTRET